MVRYDGHRVSATTVLCLLRGEGLILEANYQRARRELAAGRKAAFALRRPARTKSGSWTSPSSRPPPEGPGASPGVGATGASTSTRFHTSPTANMHDAIAAAELALAEAAELTGRPLRDLAQVDADGNVVPVVTIATDNGRPFRSFRFEAFIATHPELRHVRTPGQNGSRERGFGSLKYERLFLEEIPDAIDLAAHAEGYRIEYNTVRPHEAIAWNRRSRSTLGHPDAKIPNLPEPQNLPST